MTDWKEWCKECKNLGDDYFCYKYNVEISIASEACQSDYYWCEYLERSRDKENESL